jgi:uncharacterized protein YjlB
MAPSIEPDVYVFDDDGTIPNNRLGLLVYRGVVDGLSAQRCVDLLASNGWGDGWVTGVYPFHHYHSTSHEVLGCFRGWRMSSSAARPARCCTSKPAMRS